MEISFASPLPLGQGELCLDFTGELNNKLKGFYRCKYTGEDGSEKFCASVLRIEQQIERILQM